MQTELEAPVTSTEDEEWYRQMKEESAAQNEERWRTVIQPKLIDLASRGAQEGLEKLAADDREDGRADSAQYLLDNPDSWVAAWAEPDVWGEAGEQRENYATLWVLAVPDFETAVMLVIALANYGGDECDAIYVDGKLWVRIWWD